MGSDNGDKQEGGSVFKLVPGVLIPLAIGAWLAAALLTFVGDNRKSVAGVFSPYPDPEARDPRPGTRCLSGGGRSAVVWGRLQDHARLVAAVDVARRGRRVVRVRPRWRARGIAEKNHDT